MGPTHKKGKNLIENKQRARSMTENLSAKLTKLQDMLLMTDLYRCGIDYYSHRDYTGHRDATLEDAAKRACDLGLIHLFQNPDNKKHISSRYDPMTEQIQCEDGKLLDKNGSAAAEVSGVLLLGSNHLLWRIREDDWRLNWKTKEIALSEKFGKKVVQPEMAELIAFGATLEAKNIFDKHGIPAAIFYMPSDLPSWIQVKNLQEIRAQYKQDKVIDPFMADLLKEYGLSRCQVVSNQLLQSDASSKNLISSGKAIWYALESEFRKRAAKLLEMLVKKGIEPTAEKFFPGGLAEWRAQNRENGYTWRLFLDDRIYTLKISSKHEKPVYIPIGVEMALEDGGTAPGSPMCALITSALLMTCQKNFNFSHVFAAFHKDEVPAASGGFFIGRRLFGIQMHTYALGINRDIYAVESSGRDGRHAANRWLIKNPWHLELLDKVTKDIDKSAPGGGVPKVHPYGEDGTSYALLEDGQIMIMNPRILNIKPRKT